MSLRRASRRRRVCGCCGQTRPVQNHDEHYDYEAVPGKIGALSAFRKGITRHWLKSLRRRSQRHRLA